MTPQKKRHDKLKAQGICVRCGQRESLAGKSRCEECRVKTNQEMRSFNARKKAKGICYSCKNPASEGGTRCKACKEKFNLYWREYRAKYRSWFAAIQKKYVLKLKIECIDAYGGKCACCGETMPAFLCLDHVYNDGGEERKRLNKHGVDFYRWLKKQGFPKGRYQILCYNCNLAKSHYGTCPHQQMEG